MRAPLVIKLGGAALEDDSIVAPVCEAIARVRASGQEIVVVHGGGPAINRALVARGIRFEFRNGQRVTTGEMMGVISATLLWEVNSRIVAALRKAGCLAVRATGTLACTPADPALGRVGRIERVATRKLFKLSEAAVPVVPPLGHGADGDAFNINADWAASRIASALGARAAAFVTDQDGIWNADRAIEAELDRTSLRLAVETGTVQGGMRVKVEAILYALSTGVERAHVLSALAFARDFPALGGTRCTLERSPVHAEA